MSWLTRLKKRFNKSQEEPASIEAVELVYEPSPFTALIETPEEISPDAVSGEFNTVYRWQGPAIEEYIPIWGDWIGTGHTTLGLYHSASGYFNLFSGLDCSQLIFRLTLGSAGKEWQPLGGDWDGDGKDGVGLYNIETGTFLICNALDNPHAIVENSFKNEHHRSGDVAISGDWNGDGLDEVGVYNPKHGEFTLFDSLSPGCKFSIHPAHNVGPDWTPVTGDWRGIGFDSIGLYDNEAGIFYLLNAADDQDPEIIIPVNKEIGYWRPLSLKGFTALKEADEQQTLPAETGDANGESAWVGKINGLIKVKKYREALNQADKALQVNPRSSQLSQVRGKAASKLKLYDLAEISLQNSLLKDAEDIETLIELGGLTEAQEKWDKALLYWDLSLPIAKERKQKFDVLSAKAYALIELKSYDQADKIYQGLKKQFSGKPLAWMGLANVARVKGDWLAMNERLQDCIDRFPSHREVSKWKLQRAESLLALEEFEEANDIYSSIPGNHPGQIKALEALSNSAMASKQWDRAIEYYEKCAFLLPQKHNKTRQYRLKAHELMIKSGRHDEAETLLQELAKTYPNNPRVKRLMKKANL